MFLYDVNSLVKATKEYPLNKIIHEVKNKWEEATVYLEPGNSIVLYVNHPSANLSELTDLVMRICSDWDRVRYLHNHYGIFVQRCDGNKTDLAITV